MSNRVHLIVAPQEFSKANHRDLWHELARNSDATTVVLNIGADLVVSLIKRRLFRIRDSIRGPIQMAPNLIVVRPFFLVRPEISGSVLNRFNMMLLRAQLRRAIPGIAEADLRVLFYGGQWARLLRTIFPRARFFYYVLDEVTRTASSDVIHAQRSQNDFIACRDSEHIFLMTESLRAHRIQFNEKLTVVGNGASIPQTSGAHTARFERSVGLIGNLRDWIDTDLLEHLVSIRPDLNFGLVGNIENNISGFISRLLTQYSNVQYHGAVTKTEVSEWYRRFEVCIVPYKQNTFIQASRPIKIVESIFAGTPVVTVPISGYIESEFIRFARTATEFSFHIDELRSRELNQHSEAYRSFVEHNSWSRIAKTLLHAF